MTRPVTTAANHDAPAPDIPAPGAPAPDTARQLLDRLDALVRRHRALAHDDAAPLHAELITAEVAMQLAEARRALRRTPVPGGA